MVKWETMTLGSIGDFTKGRGIRKNETHSGKIPCVRYGEIYTHHNDYIKAYHSYISAKVADTSRRLRTGELLFAGSGETKEEIGKCVAFIDDCEAYAGGDIVILTPEKDVNSLFLGYYLNSQPIVEQKANRGQGDAIVHISAISLAEIEIQLPPLSEQRRIAEALTDMDALLAAMEKLIAKKRTIKQGAMQELLTGKRRLPGFEGTWASTPIRELTDIISGGTPSTTVSEYWNGSIVWVSPTDITGQKSKYLSSSERKITQKGLENSAAILLPTGTLLLCTRATIGELAIAAQPTATNQGFKNLVCFDSTNNEWLYYAIQPMKSKMTEQASGSTFLEISKTTLGNIEILTPPTVAEQTAIASILSDMDAEIDALMSKLNKLRNIKQGMMSELLTGRIRLIKHDANAAPEAVVMPKVIELPKREPQPAATPTGNHNTAIEDAVILAVVTGLYATEKHPLSPFYAQKLPYLLHRHMKGVATGYHKLAAGPYNAELKYRTALPIAKKNRYVITRKMKYKGTTYEAMLIGENIKQANGYFAQWHGDEPLKWLEQFRYTKNRRDELELLTTVDMAMEELREIGSPICVQAIKTIIQSSEEWKAKLKRETFSDTNIARAIKWSNDLFGQEV